MDHVTFELLYEGIDRIRAKDMLNGFSVSTYPHMKSKDASKIHKNLFKLAYPSVKDKIIKTTDVLKMGLQP